MKASTSASLQSRYAKPIRSPAREARKAVLRRLQRQEIRKLQQCVPSIAQRHQRVDDVTILEEAVKYIDQLHMTLMARLRAGNMPEDIMQRINPVDLNRIAVSLSRPQTRVARASTMARPILSVMNSNFVGRSNGQSIMEVRLSK